MGSGWGAQRQKWRESGGGRLQVGGVPASSGGWQQGQEVSGLGKHAEVRLEGLVEALDGRKSAPDSRLELAEGQVGPAVAGPVPTIQDSWCPAGTCFPRAGCQEAARGTWGRRGLGPGGRTVMANAPGVDYVQLTSRDTTTSSEGAASPLSAPPPA